MRVQGVVMLALITGAMGVACDSADEGAPSQPGAAVAGDTRPYLLEQVGVAAVVQLYADGFDALPLLEQVWPGVSGGRRAGLGWSAFICRVARHPHRAGDQRQHDDTLNTHDHLLPFRTED